MPKYRILEASHNGRPAIIVVDDSLALEADRPSFPYLMTIRLPLRSFDRSTGLCDRPESARLDGVEDALFSLLDRTQYRYLGHVTSNGVREILLYVADGESMIGPVQKALASAGEDAATITLRGDPKWDYYQQFC